MGGFFLQVFEVAGFAPDGYLEKSFFDLLPRANLLILQLQTSPSMSRNLSLVDQQVSSKTLLNFEFLEIL